MAVKSHLAQETSSDDLLAYDQTLVEYVRAPWTYWDQYVQGISGVADLLIEFGHDSDLRRAMTMMASHMYSLRGDVGQSVTNKQSFRPRLQAVLQSYVKESRTGYNSAEVEGIVFGFMPEWLTREAARAFKVSGVMDKWLKRHEAFVKG